MTIQAADTAAADRLAIATSPAATVKTMDLAGLVAADFEFARRANLLGKPGQLTRTHKAVRAEIAHRTK